VFVRTKKVNGREYRQLVENVRIEGKHRQRVVAHLGAHETVEDALEDSRRRLRDLQESKLMTQSEEAAVMAARWEKRLRHNYGEVLDRFHGGEIPSWREYAAKAGQLEQAPHTDEIDFTLYGETVYKRAVVPRTAEQLEYCQAFGDKVRVLDKPTTYGHTYVFPDAHSFESDLRQYDYWRHRASWNLGEYNRKSVKLQRKIAKLEAVVTRMANARPDPAVV
jgi:hypothetical protein